MWPKHNFESGFGDWRNRSSGSGWGGGRSVGTSRNWKSWPAENRSTNNQKKAKTKPISKKPTKRSLSKTGTKTKTVANKRQKVVNYSQLPLTKVMLVNPGTKDGGLPELVFGGFYDCVREAKMGKPRHLLQVEVTKKSEKKKGEDTSAQADWRVSIPVPTTSVEAVSIVSGDNPFEKVLKAHSDRISLKNSIEHWNKVIRGRTLALQKKEEELQNLQKIEEELEAASQAKADAEEKPEEDVVKGTDTDKNTESSPTKSESPTKSDSAGPEVDEEETDLTKEKKTDVSKEELEKKEKEELEKKEKDELEKKEKEELEKKKKKERETRIRKKKFVISVVKKLTSAVETAKQSLAIQQAKLDKISGELGDELAYFQKEIADDEAVSYFKQQLQEGTQSTDEQDKDADMEDAAENDKEDVEMDADTEPVEKPKEAEDTETVEKSKDAEDTETIEKSKEAEDDSSDVEMVEAKDKALAETEKSETQENDSVEKVKKVESPKKIELGKITDIPVWLVVSLKKPLDKAIVSKNAPLSVKDHLKKASMIIMKFHPKQKKTIVLKGVTLQGSEKYLKILNQVLEGPWKAIRKDPNEFMKGKSPYSLMKNLRYLVMCQTRREVLDNIIENCPLCGKALKRMAMEQHLKEFCPMREEECEYCGLVLPVSAMEEHHENECTKFPISCPDKCSKKFPRSEAEEHKKVCLNATVECEFKSFGCSKQIKRKDLSRHLKIAVFQHLELVKGRVTILTDYMMKNDPTLKDIIEPTCEEPEAE